MKLIVVLFVLLNSWKTFAQSFNGEQFRNSKQNEGSLTDIRWVSLKVNPEKPEIENKEAIGDFHATQPQQQQQQQQQVHPSGVQTVQNTREYIQKMANQLFLTQKHVPLLSEYQKFIINQDPLVRKYVFENRETSPGDETENPQANRKSRALYYDGGSRNVGSRSIGKKSNVTAKNYEVIDLASQSNDLHHLALTLTPNLGNVFKLDPGLTPKFPFVRAVQPYDYYNLANGGDIQTQHLLQGIPHAPSTPSPFSHLGLGSHKTFPIHHIKTDKHHHGEDHYESEGEGYKFVYDVKDEKKGTDFGHKEVKDRDKTYGHYYLKLPDGRFETVKYWADKTGFHANVEFKGRAVHPEQRSHFHHHQHHHHHHGDV